MRNPIADVPGVLVGNAQDARAATGAPAVLTEIGAVAADCLARAVARGVYAATALPFARAVPGWRSRFGIMREGAAR